MLASLERMHWLAATPNGFDLYTDHNNPIFLFDRLSVVSDLSQTTLRKFLRWAVRLSMYNYTCFHIKGADNVWAILLGGWSFTPIIRRLVRIPELPSSSASGFEWITLEEIYQTQTDSENQRPGNLVKVADVWRNEEGSIWVPDTVSDLQLRLCIIAHTGPSGRRGASSTESVLGAHYFWSMMASDLRSFVRACIYCLSTVGGGKIPRPFFPSVHGTAPNVLIQFDDIELGPSTDGCKYVLMLRDDRSDYKWFFAFSDTSAENAAHAIIDWCAAFGVPKELMSDGPTHFKNETVRAVTRRLKVPHHFTLPFTPWSNGAVERLGKELLRVFQSIVSELQIKFEEWPDLLPVVQGALNNAPSPQRGNISPITCFLGRDPTPPIGTFLRTKNTEMVLLEDIDRERMLNVSLLKRRVSELHPMFGMELEANRRRKRQAASRGELPNFTEGDFVLVAREDFFADEKLALRWRGPRRVIKALSEYVFQVEDLRNGSTEDVHGSRLKFYRDFLLTSEVTFSNVLSSETVMPVGRLMRPADTEDGLKVIVR